jgi:hypothetical protein
MAVGASERKGPTSPVYDAAVENNQQRAIRPELGRRMLVRGGVGLTLGISALPLPAAADSASFTDTASMQTLQGLAIDDTGTPATGDDVRIAVRLLQPDGTTYTAAASVSLTVRIDDGTDGGLGGHPEGLTVNGALVTAVAPTVTVALPAGDTGTAVFSIGLPATGNYLVSVGTQPPSLNHPSGVVLVLTHGI